jgi:perosamine synthetase
VFVPSLPPLDPRLFVASTPLGGRWPLDRIGRDDAQLFYLARAGVFQAVRHFAAGGRVLMPAYHHGVEVAAARATGATVELYRVRADLRIDVEDLTRRAQAADTRVIYVTHFIGFAQPLDDIVALCRARGLRLIEDCALALGARDRSGVPVGARGDAAIFCLYKSLPVPHGGLLVGRVPQAKVAPAPGMSTLHHLAGQLLAHFELRRPSLGRPLRAALRGAAHATVDHVVAHQPTGTQSLGPRDLGLGASPLVRHLCRRVHLPEVVARRRRNFQTLAALLDGFDVVGAPLGDGDCPLFLPLRVRDKRRMHAALQARGIDAIDFWNTGESPFPEVAALRRQILELPCHQALDDGDLARVARAVKELALHA